VQQFARSARKPEGFIGMGQAIVRHQRGHVRQFGLLRAQKLFSRRDVEKQVAHRDGGAGRQCVLFAAQHLSARHFNARAGCLFRRARFQQKA